MRQIKDKQYICAVCKSKYIKKHPFQKWCSPECGSELALKKMKKEKEREEIEKRKAWKVEKEERRHELTGGNNQLQVAVNQIARLLDKDKPCIARPTERAYEWHGGHVFSTNAYPNIRYNLWNIHKQCHKSNTMLGGEKDLMLEGIEERYGAETRAMVESLPATYPVCQFKAWQLKEALKQANQIIRELKAGKIYTRDEVNEKIGLYLHK